MAAGLLKAGDTLVAVHRGTEHQAIVLDDGRIIFQQPLEEAARRLSTGMEREQPVGDGVLYTEKTLGGWVVVRERTATMT